MTVKVAPGLVESAFADYGTGDSLSRPSLQGDAYDLLPCKGVPCRRTVPYKPRLRFPQPVMVSAAHACENVIAC